MSHTTAPLSECLDSILTRLASLESKAGVTPSVSIPPPPSLPSKATPSSSSSSAASPSLVKYDAYIASTFPPFTKACAALGGQAVIIGDAMKTAWDCQRSFLVKASLSKKPDASKLQAFFKPYMDASGTIKPDRSIYENHQKAAKEAINCLQWISIAKPTDFLKESIGGCDMYTNKIRVLYKGGKDAKQIAFCDTFKVVLNGLIDYVKGSHMSGVAYNATGGDISAAKDAPAASAGKGNLFAELSGKSTSAGDSAATGLKTVGKDQQTWRKEFAGGASATPVVKSSVPARAVVKKILGTPKCEYQDAGSKWVIECNSKDTTPNGVLEIVIADPKMQVYIWKCEDITIDIKGKCKTIAIDGCVKVNVLFDSCISSCELVNCKRMAVQARGICPSIAIDKTDGCVVYLTKEAVNVTGFVTSKSSEMNVSWPEEGGDMVEAPIPEQFQHKLVKNKEGKVQISSEVSDLYSH